MAWLSWIGTRLQMFEIVRIRVHTRTRGSFCVFAIKSSRPCIQYETMCTWDVRKFFVFLPLSHRLCNLPLLFVRKIGRFFNPFSMRASHVHAPYSYGYWTELRFTSPGDDTKIASQSPTLLPSDSSSWFDVSSMILSDWRTECTMGIVPIHMAIARMICDEPTILASATVIERSDWMYCLPCTRTIFLL